MGYQAAVLFVDLQEGLVETARTQNASHLRRGARALAQVAKALALPSFASGIPLGPDGGPPLLHEIKEELPDIIMSPRRSFGAFATVQSQWSSAAQRRVLVIAGVLTEVAVLRTALDARNAGWDVRVIVDACAGLSDRTESAAFRQIEAEGGVTTCVASLAAEFVTDIGSPPGGAVLAILRSLLDG